MFEENREKQILISKIEDKIEFCKKKNTIEYTDFLDINQKGIALEVFKTARFTNYIINDDENEFDRNIIILYPDKLDKQDAIKFYRNIVDFIKIENPRESKYEHRVYLSGIMKLGIKREKFGDIIVKEDEANIIIFKELSEYISGELKNLTRFQKSNINILPITDLKIKKAEFEELNIIVHSLRLDGIVAEIAKSSREKAKEIVEDGRVFINNKCEIKISKNLNIGDIVTIRGSGKYIFDSIENTTKKGNLILRFKKYK